MGGWLAVVGGGVELEWDAGSPGPDTSIMEALQRDQGQGGRGQHSKTRNPYWNRPPPTTPEGPLVGGTLW